MVEQIERLGAERDLDALVELEILDQGQVEIDAARSEQSIAAQAAVGVQGRGSERGRIEPALQCALVGGKRRIAQAVGTAAGSIGRGGLQARSALVVEVCKPGVNGKPVCTVTKPFVRQPPSRKPATPCGWNGIWKM